MTAPTTPPPVWNKEDWARAHAICDLNWIDSEAVRRDIAVAFAAVRAKAETPLRARIAELEEEVSRVRGLINRAEAQEATLREAASANKEDVKRANDYHLGRLGDDLAAQFAAVRAPLEARIAELEAKLATSTDGLFQLGDMVKARENALREASDVCRAVQRQCDRIRVHEGSADSCAEEILDLVKPPEKDAKQDLGVKPCEVSSEDWTDAGTIGSADEARWQKEELSVRVDAFLRARGWRHTSSTPASLWLWTKMIDGHEYYVDQAMALRMQSTMDGASDPISNEAKETR
jgi:hypothetical protein